MHLMQGGRLAGSIPTPTAVAIGMFDGVHLGHQALIRRAKELAQKMGLAPLALTFDRHADEILRPEKARPYLTTLAEKVDAIRATGVSLVVVARVTPAFLSIQAADFVSVSLSRELHAQAIVVGPDFRFGQGRQGDVNLLRSLQEKCGYALEVLDLVTVDGEPVSSTLIRRTLSAGDVTRSHHLLGRPYRLSGPVIRGDGIGRRLGFPTANIAYPAQKILPALGVYACVACVDGARYGAAVNVGRRPTFEGTRVTVEAHLLDFTGDLYGKELAIHFVQRLRFEEKFASSEALARRIAADVEQARELLAHALTSDELCASVLG